MANLSDKKFLIDFKKSGCYSDACGESICNVKEPQFNYLAEKLFEKTYIYANKSLEFWNSCFFSGCYWDVRFLSKLYFHKTLLMKSTKGTHYRFQRTYSGHSCKKIHWGSNINLNILKS